MALAPQGDAEPGISTIAPGVAQSGERGVGIATTLTVESDASVKTGKKGVMTRRATAVPNTDRVRSMLSPGERHRNVR